MATLFTTVSSKQGGQFISSWKTNNAGTSSSTQITVPTVSSGSYNCFVDWGDGNISTLITTYNDAQWTHTYSGAGTYTVKISGTFTGFQFNNGGDRQKLLNISQWGTFKFGNTGAYFYGCINATFTARDVPSLVGTTTFASAFRGCSVSGTIPNMGNWNTSGITSLFACFLGAGTFNTNINGWNVSSVTDFGNTFGNCGSFNQPLDNWNTAAATTMTFMFSTCTAFNQNIGGWSVGNVTDMSSMFASAAAFNQSLNSWDVSKVTNFSSMFAMGGGSAFNGNITSWNVGAGVNFSVMFLACTAFNQNIGSWSVTNATNISQMFQGATIFNQSLNSWNTTKVTNMFAVFLGASAFNGNITSWNTGNVTRMDRMFNTAVAFNQAITAWNTVKVTTFSQMFDGATVFNQDVSAWLITVMANATLMFNSSGFTITNYNKLLDSVTGWPSQATILSNVTFSAGTAHYSGANAIAGRAVLTGTKTWTISDGGTP